eukprot:GFUD01001435.1.p1 GENE.GFUD01001435.1~~GFUD01001435.1.p1  ORF type:complete len:290 (+),score=72.04 GFUD01001435.1:52-921(+)
MMKITKKYKTKKRLKALSQVEQSNSLLKNIEGAGILSEIHPIAAGVYNTTYFVIIPHRAQSKKESASKNGAQMSRNNQESADKENQSITQRSSNLKPSNVKPKYTYRELITKALLDKKSLTLSGIYSWICTLYPYYSVTDDKWKNSIRHNLSLYPEFMKGAKTQQSAGHLWFLDQEFRRKQEEEESLEPNKNLEVSELQTVTHIEELVEDVIDAEEHMSIIPSFFQDQSRFLSHSTPPELQKSAEEILAGIKRPTAVEGNVCLPVTFTNSQEDFHHCLKFPFFDEERET